MLWVNLLMWLMVLCDGLGTWTWDRCNENNGLTFLSSKYHHRFSSVINLGLLPGRMGLYVTWCASQLHQSAHHLNFLWRQHLPLQVLLGSPVMLTYKHTRHAWCHAVINTSTTLSLKGSLCCQLTVLTLLTLVSLEMANEPASPLPLAHVAANSAALLVFDEWNDCFPSPVGYSINGEQQVYWDVAYTFDKFQQEGKSENTPLRKFMSQMRSVATSHSFLGSSSIHILNNTHRPWIICFGCPNWFSSLPK